MERAPGPASSERKLKAAIVENAEAVKSASRDAAESRITHERQEIHGWGLGAIKKRVWDYGLMNRINLGRRTAEAEREIVEKKNIYAVEGLEREAQERTREALIERFTSEYEEAIHTEAGESRHVNEESERISSARIKELLKLYARDEIDEANFIEEKNRIIAEAFGWKDAEKAHAAVYHADNLLEIAREVKLMASHHDGIDALVADLDVVIGRAKSGVRTEANFDAVDRIVDKIQTTRLGMLVNETTIAFAVGAGFMMLERFGRSRVAAYATFGGSAAAGGLIAGFRENARVKAERKRYAREKAQGKNLTESPDKEEHEQYRYTTGSAKDLIAGLNTEGVDLSREENYGRMCATLADVEARIQLSDRKKIDLIAYSDIASVEKERLELDIARAKAKVALRSIDRSGFRTSMPNVDAALRSEVAILRDHLESGEMDEKDKLFNKMKAKKVAKATTIGLGVGLVIGTAVQEGAAALFHNQQGLVHGSGRGATEKLPESVTALQSLRMFLSGQEYGGTPSAPGDWRVYDLPGGKAALRLPEGLRLSHDPDKANGDPTSWVLRRADGSVIPLAHTEVVDGKLTPKTLQALKAQGIILGTGEEIFQEITRKPKQITHTVPEYIESHTGKKPDWFTQIRRQFWYDQNSPYKSIGNALRLHWGGVKGTGIDANGNYVFNVLRMTPGGSFHGKEALNAQNAIRTGQLKMLLSVSRDTQASVVEVPIHPDGNAVIDPDTPIGKMFFEKVNGKAVFKGAFAEVGIGAGEKDGVSQVRVLATHGGEGSATMENPKVTPPPTTVWEEEVRYVPITTLHAPPPDYYTAPPPIIPVPLHRAPLQKMKEREPQPYGYGESMRDRYLSDLNQFRNMRTPETLAALRRQFEEAVETSSNPGFQERYGFLLKELRELEYWHLVPAARRTEINARLQFRYKRYDSEEERSQPETESKREERRNRERDRIYRQIENVLLEENTVGHKPFSKEFYDGAPLVRGLERADEVVVVLDNPIGDAIVSLPAVLALDAYFKQNNIQKPITVVTQHTKLLESLKDQFPGLRLVHRDDARAVFTQEQHYGQRYIVNLNHYFDDYEALGVSPDAAKSWKESQTDPQVVLSLNWRNLVREEFPINAKTTKKYDRIPARILRLFEIMIGQKLFADINKLDHLLEKRADFEQQKEYIARKYDIKEDEKIVVITMGAGVMPKEYQPEKWSAFLMKVYDAYPHTHVLFMPDPHMETQARYEPMLDELITAKHYRISKVDDDKEYFNTIMSMADVVVTPDTGLGHLASALGTPNVVIGVISNPVEWSGAKTFPVMHPKSRDLIRQGVSVHDTLWWSHNASQYLAEEKNGELTGASQVPVERVFEAFEKAIAGESAPPMPDTEPAAETVPSNEPITVKIEFGNFGSGIGNLETDGFEARISNSSHNEDALAVSADKKVFVVADGLGGAGAFYREGQTSKWARAIAEAVAVRGDIGSLTKGNNLRNLVLAVKSDLESKGVSFELTSNVRSTMAGVLTTLAAAERVGENTFTILAIGDSPIYVVDASTGAVTKQYGEDILKGFNDDAVENAIGMNQKGQIRRISKPQFVANERVEITPGQLLVLGSDFFSDYTDAGGNLKQYIGVNPEAFHNMAMDPTMRAKVDDATLVVVDPYKLPWKEETPQPAVAA